MDRMVDHLFAFEGEGVIRDFPGNYSQYREAVAKGEELQKAAERISHIIEELDEKEMRWLELSEKTA
jgi:ATP-binding cassette subfamily F protein uup